jgi:hypothetical protein
MVASDGGECMVEGSNLGLFGGQLWCNNHPQNQQNQPNPTQTIEATRLVFLVLMVCNHRQHSFIDYHISECGLGQITSLMFFVSMLCSLGQHTFIDYLIAFTGLWPWANHFTSFMLCSLG